MTGPGSPLSNASRVLLVRHGATAPNLAGLRCGGDLDVELVDAGREQARAAARQLAAWEPSPALIVASSLRRARETAAIIGAALGGIEAVVDAGFDERHLGAWTLLPIAATEAWLRERRTPPGGEPEADFVGRVRAALEGLRPLLARRPVLVTSKGVARAIGVVTGHPSANALGNGEIMAFDLPAPAFTFCHACQGCPA
jgi:probable phosphoglycerate mutase